jgi:hypothetical protein
MTAPLGSLVVPATDVKPWAKSVAARHEVKNKPINFAIERSLFSKVVKL